MFLCFFMILLSFCIFYFSSLHSLIILLFVEMFILITILIFFCIFFSWFSCLLFLLVAVCIGAYGVSLLISTSRGEGFSYFLFF